MRILSIETSCDETAIAIIEYQRPHKSGPQSSAFSPHLVHVLANLVSSQIEIHKPYGGVVPNLARREHEKNLVPILMEALKKSKMLNQGKKIPNSKFKILGSILEREPVLLKYFKKEILGMRAPEVDTIAVTYGPGLAPALWVGVNFARALSYIWSKPLIPVNHMEGHIFSALLSQSRKANTKSQNLNPKQIPNSKFQILKPKFPALALLVSGGHTELVLTPKLGKYKIVGETIDDASGEAFDKVARILGLPYPGGPNISALAKMKIPNSKFSAKGRSAPGGQIPKLPRPMLHSKDFNFSFSGLKTAVLYLTRDLARQGPLSVEIKSAVAKEFQDAVVEVLVTKTRRAAEKYNAKSILLGGGVAANYELRGKLGQALKKEIRNSKFYIPNSILTGDNALMIALTAAITGKKKSWSKVKAEANLRFRPFA